MKKVFTNGCFDILHRAHFELLRYCKGLGDWVIVGVNSDASIKRIKDPSRPYNKEDDRVFMLQGCKYVDEVIVFHEDTPLELVKKLSPSLIVKGGDYNVEDVAGHEIAEVKIFNYIEGYSTTRILENKKEALTHDKEKRNADLAN